MENESGKSSIPMWSRKSEYRKGNMSMEKTRIEKALGETEENAEIVRQIIDVLAQHKVSVFLAQKLLGEAESALRMETKVI